MKLEIAMVDDAAAAHALVYAGWCPVECSFGAESVVDGLLMDHHGRHSHREAVAIRAFRDHYGARAADPRFVLTGVADADATFAIAALAGLLPRGNAASQAGVATIHVGALAATVAIMDNDPIAQDLLALPHGETLLCWNTFFGGGRDRLAAFAGVQGWRTLTALDADRRAAFLGAAREANATRRRKAQEEIARCGRRIGSVLLLLGTAAPAFDVWYGRRADRGASTDPAGWDAPVVIARAAQGSVTIGCPNAVVAEVLFGPGGLKAIYPHFQPAGWGGREAIGGAPRGARLNAEEVVAAGEAVARML